MPDPHTCSGICAVYSIVGMIFMCWVGVMLQTQPFFVSGIEDPVESAKAAYGAAGMFIVCFVASLCGLFCYGRTNLPDIVSHLNDLDDQDIYRSQMQRHFPIPHYAGESPYVQRAVNNSNAASRNRTNRNAAATRQTGSSSSTTSRGSNATNLRRRSGGPNIPDNNNNQTITIELTSSKDESSNSVEPSSNIQNVDSPLASPLKKKGQEVEDLLGLDSGEFI